VLPLASGDQPDRQQGADDARDPGGAQRQQHAAQLGNDKQHDAEKGDYCNAQNDNRVHHGAFDFFADAGVLLDLLGQALQNVV